MTDSSKRPLVFDLDGTLIDSRLDIAAACNFALQSAGLRALSVAQVSSHVGNGARELLHGVLKEVSTVESTSGTKVQELLLSFQEYYKRHPTAHNAFMPGAVDAIALRRHRPVALCTNKPAQLTALVVGSLSWDSCFDSIVAPNPGDRVKPDGMLLQRVADELSVQAESLIMVGDGPQDIGAARAVGAHAIGVKGGFLPLRRLEEAKPNVLLESLLFLPAYLNELGI